MRDWTSYDENGPLISMGTVAFSARAENLPGDKHTFELPVFMAASEETTVIVEYNGLRLRDFGTCSDYYGFGTSPATALSDAQDHINTLEGINADIIARTTIMMRPCIISEDRPFYTGAQRVHYIPMNWSHSRPDINDTKQDFAVWQNGGPTGDATYFHDRIRELVEADAAPSRKGDMRSIIRGKTATSRAEFLSIAQSN